MPPDGPHGALLISKDNEAWIAAPSIDASKAYNAVGGLGLLLKAGKNVVAADALAPRTAVGVSKDLGVFAGPLVGTSNH